MGKTWYQKRCWNPYEGETLTYNGKTYNWDNRSEMCKFADYLYKHR